MSSAAAPPSLTYDEVLEIIERWKTEGITDEERDAFLEAANGAGRSDLHDFQQIISDIADSAKKIDAAFDEVDSSFDWITTLQLILQYPEIFSYYAEWKGYKNRWRTCLRRSLNVADENIDILRRFDQVYLSKVENIQTEQDRLNAIQALKQFIDEKHDHSDAMSRDFLDLKRDLKHFVDKFGQWVAAKGLILDAITIVIKSIIDSVEREIENIDAQIRYVKETFAIAGSSFNYMEVLSGAVVSIVIAIIIGLQMQRNEQVQLLRAYQGMLQSLQQTPIAQLKSKLDVWRPDILLMCDQLVLFAELWLYIRSQAVQFRSILQDGMGAATNMAFKRQVKLASDVCTPLQNGLRRYKANLASWA